MDSEPKKPQIDEEAMLLEIEEAEQQEINEDDQVEQEMRKMEEEESRPSGEDDDVDRLEWEHEMQEMEQLDIVQSMWADYESSESESEEDSDEDEEEDEDEYNLMVIKEVRKCVGGKA
jgi:hypothetical protein